MYHFKSSQISPLACGVATLGNAKQLFDFDEIKVLQQTEQAGASSSRVTNRNLYFATARTRRDEVNIPSVS